MIAAQNRPTNALPIGEVQGREVRNGRDRAERHRRNEVRERAKNMGGSIESTNGFNGVGKNSYPLAGFTEHYPQPELPAGVETARARISKLLQTGFRGT
jgi:hypothetical protein